MTETPSQEPETEGTTPTETLSKSKTREKRKRSRLKTIAIFSGIGIGTLIGLGIVAVVGGRYYLVSDAGRKLITTFVAGKKIGRYGEINVEGLSGDLFDDFTLDRVTVSDVDGVWLEATNVRVDWSYLPLVFRRFHADEITADQIRLIRRPVLEPPTEPGGPQALGIVIDKFAANVELLEDFSKEYGRWALSGDANIPRAGNKSANVDARSLSRTGDFLKLAATFGEDPQDLRLNLQAEEASGGPLAGALGYSPDQPFSAKALVDGRTVDMVMRTGSFTPLHVKGQFSDKGSRLSGYMDFSGSDLFVPFIERFGRTARLGFAAVPQRGREGVQGVAWRLFADNIQSSAVGYVRTKDGAFAEDIKLDVATPSLTRLAGTPLGDAARYQGVFNGDGKTFELKGAINASNVQLSDYRMARLTGPLNLSANKGEYSLSGELTAANASRQGVLGGLLGAAPRVKLSASRLADGAILVRNIDLRGSALTLTGSGRRNLLGGLSFNGDVNLSNVAALSPQASGSFGGNIRAGTQRSGAPWTLSFNGQGRRLKTGMEELDRLLGERPRLALAGSLNKGVISITQGQLNGDAGQADVIGQVQGDKLRLRLNWDANGPFGVGPLAIDGKMTGDGSLVGTINQPELALNADFDRVNLGQVVLGQTNLKLNFNKRTAGSDGDVIITSSSRGQPLLARANFRLADQLIALSGVDINGGGITAKGDIALSQSVPSSANLTFDARPGVFVERGTLNGRILLSEGGQNARADVQVDGRNFRMRGTNVLVERLALRGQGTLQRLPMAADVQIGGENPFSYRGPLVYEKQNDGHRLSMGQAGGEARGRVRDIAFTVNPDTFVQTGGNGLMANVDVGLGSGTLRANLSPAGPRRRDGGTVWNLTSNLDDVPVNAFSRDHEGTLSGTVNVSQIGAANLNGRGDITLTGARLANSRNDALNARINAVLDANSLRLQANATNTATGGDSGLRANANVSLPIDYDPQPLRLALDGNGPLSGNIAINGNIKPLYDLVDGVDRTVEGQIDTNITLGGRLNDRRFSGPIRVSNGRVDDHGIGLKLRNLNGEAQLTNDDITISRLTAADARNGQIEASGRLRFRAQGPGNMGELQVKLRDFRVADTDEVKITTSGDLRAIHTGRFVRLDGTLNVNEATIEPVFPGNTGIVRMPVTEINRPGAIETTTDTGASNSIPIILNVKVVAPEVNVRGDGIDMQLEANADVAGSINNPRLNGSAEVVRGTYEFAGKRFTFDPGGRVTLDTDPRRIQLNLTARREDPTITAIIRATGSAAEPRIVLSSEPELPQDEVLARVLFGRSISQLSPIEAAQLASAVASLAGGGGFDILGNLRQLSGLDSLSFSGDGANLMVAGGRRLTDDIYLEVIGGGESGTAVNVEWQVRRNIAVSARAGGDGNAVISVRWRKVSDR
ncbi:MAG: translocation/assembly module TamB domain-containing protein [Janthinobacterium lividum]